VNNEDPVQCGSGTAKRDTKSPMGPDLSKFGRIRAITARHQNTVTQVVKFGQKIVEGRFTDPGYGYCIWVLSLAKCRICCFRFVALNT